MSDKKILKLKFIIDNPTYKRKNIEYIINSNTGCWEVISHTSDDYGYKVITIKNKVYKIHKLVLEEKLGRKLNKNEMTLHLCDNPCCCNPEHLRCGTAKENMEDKHKRKREIYLKGSELPQAILNERQVYEIKEQLILNNGNAKIIANKYNVNPTTIMDIRALKTWKHIHNDLNEELILINNQCSKGVNHYKSNLTIEQIKEIKRLLINKNKQIDIAKQFNVSIKVISQIKTGKTYKEII